MKAPFAFLAVFMAICLVSSSAQPLNIAISSAHYTTVVSAGPHGTGPGGIEILPASVERTTTSSSPTSDDLFQYYYYPDGSPDLVFLNDPTTQNFSHAFADSGLFEVQVLTVCGDAFSGATATSDLWFSPSVDEIQTIGIQISLNYNYAFTSGSISLIDQTVGSQLWNYNWGVLPGNIPWNGSIANFNFDTAFLASHQYELQMITSSGSAQDAEQSQIQLTGLRVVPEPAALALAGLGGLALLLATRYGLIIRSARAFMGKWR